MNQITIPGKKQKGFTLIEMSVVLVIIGVLIGGIIKGKQLIDDSNATAETQTMQLLISNIHARYTNETDTGTLANATAVTARLAPPGYNMIAPGTITNGVGGAITIIPATVNGSPNDGFSITSGGYNFATCRKMTTALKKNAAKIGIGAAAPIANTAAAPITADMIDTACSTADAATPGAIPLTLVFAKNG